MGIQPWHIVFIIFFVLIPLAVIGGVVALIVMLTKNSNKPAPQFQGMPPSGYPGQYPGRYQGQYPGQYPAQPQGQYPNQYPSQYPGQYPMQGGYQQQDGGWQQPQQYNSPDGFGWDGSN